MSERLAALRRRLGRVPWPLSLAVIVVALSAMGAATSYFTADLYHESCLNERNALTGQVEASNCGEGAKAARARAAAPSPSPSPPSAGDAPAAPPPASPSPSPPAAPPAGPGVLATGQLRNGEPGHEGSGMVELQRLADGSLNLLLKGFSVTNGPDLYVVLGKDADGDYRAGDLVLQKLKANNGTQNYALPAGTETAAFRTVIIWCRRFDVTFAYAPLEVP